MLTRTIAIYAEFDLFVKGAKQRTVITAVFASIFTATLIILLIPTLVPLAKIGMYPLMVGISFVAAALIRKHQGYAMWELSIIGQGIALIGVALFIIAILL